PVLGIVDVADDHARVVGPQRSALVFIATDFNAGDTRVFDATGVELGDEIGLVVSRRIVDFARAQAALEGRAAEVRRARVDARAAVLRLVAQRQVGRELV